MKLLCLKKSEKAHGIGAEEIVEKTLSALKIIFTQRKLSPVRKVAITAGSRGIANYLTVLRTVVKFIREQGGEPFLVPAMGSHGGGTVAGRRAVLAGLGITEESVGAPIKDGDDVAEVGRAGELPVYTDARAKTADAILLINRIKPHTAFRGQRESGLLKMLVVGLGKVPGATLFHRLPPEHLAETLDAMGQMLLKNLPVLGGIALVEDAAEQTVLIEGIPAGEIPAREAELLKTARALLPRLPFTGADLLIVDEMGKNFSGTGMDTNVIGRFRIEGVPEPENPPAKRIFVRGLSPLSEGNANGIGLADFTTVRLIQAMDRRATYLNVLTTGYLHRGMLPLIFETDREALEAAAKSLKKTLPECSVAWIKNTLHLQELLVTPELAEPCRNAGYEPGKEVELAFDADGNLVPCWE
ncbi:MAG: DUF2088 domain-containing protein [Bacillota bacterium]